MAESLILESSPHLWSGRGVQTVMGEVLLALAPATLAGIYFFGPAAALTIATSLLGAVGGEALLQHLRHRPVRIGDLSAAVTGLLLALSLPPQLPWWVPAFGGFLAVGLVKEFFGGLGSNFLNPALAARAFLMAAWPDLLTHFTRPFDAVGSATPLAQAGFSHASLFYGAVPGSLGETFHPGILLGGLYLWSRGIIDLAAPAGFLLSLGLGGLLSGVGLSHSFLTGGALLAAFFMTTDYPTTPLTRIGRWLFGLGAGTVAALIRSQGPMPEGVTYGILLMNLATPLLDRFLAPRGLRR